MSNLYDYTPDASTYTSPGACTIDAWALGEFERVRTAVIDAYERYDFRTAHSSLYQFCNDAMSSTYLAAIKDRMYCDPADGERRRRSQAALYRIAEGLCQLIAPLLPHTADEAWQCLPAPADSGLTNTPDSVPNARMASVHLAEFPAAAAVEVSPDWEKVMTMREAALKALEEAKARGIENPLDAGLVFPDPDGTLGAFDLVDLADLLGVSLVALDKTGDKTGDKAGDKTGDKTGSEVEVTDLRDAPRCERSRKRDGTVKERADGALLSDRDAAAIQTA